MEKPKQTRSICFEFNSCMNDPELNEDIHQYPIRPNLKLDSCSQISEDNITVILPTMKPQTDEMNNMRFVINKLLDINLTVMIVEQSIDKYSYLFKFIECIKGRE